MQNTWKTPLVTAGIVLLCGGVAAPRNDDDANNAEGDAIGYQGAKPVFDAMGAGSRLALDLDIGGGGHSFKPAQARHLVAFANTVWSGAALPPDVEAHLRTDPYLAAGTYDTCFRGLDIMMPWRSALPHLTPLSVR
jgi:hypothetical protein